jgi:hypothetical protein
LQERGWRVEGEHLLVQDFPVQFLAASGLTEEAVRKARTIEYEGVPAKVFRPEHRRGAPPKRTATRDEKKIFRLHGGFAGPIAH